MFLLLLDFLSAGDAAQQDRYYKCFATVFSLSFSQGLSQQEQLSGPKTVSSTSIWYEHRSSREAVAEAGSALQLHHWLRKSMKTSLLYITTRWITHLPFVFMIMHLVYKKNRLDLNLCLFQRCTVSKWMNNDWIQSMFLSRHTYSKCQRVNINFQSLTV